VGDERAPYQTGCDAYACEYHICLNQIKDRIENLVLPEQIELLDDKEDGPSRRCSFLRGSFCGFTRMHLFPSVDHIKQHLVKRRASFLAALYSLLLNILLDWMLIESVHNYSSYLGVHGAQERILNVTQYRRAIHMLKSA